MEALTTIKEVLENNKIFVPDYQRAYSWETKKEDKNSPKQVDTFLLDLEEYRNSGTKSKYYFGHFLFEAKLDGKFGVIDGQQRLTTIVIFLSAAYQCLKAKINLIKKDSKNAIEQKLTYQFSTVDYDDQFFKDYVINQIRKNRKRLDTESAKRIADAFDFFTKHLSKKDVDYLRRMIEIIESASCTTHPVEDESEAIQMFIFQNNRGKKPSNLEIIKAQFMFNVHLYGGTERESIINEIKRRFEKIYKSISAIEYKINEDEVLNYTFRVYFNSLAKANVLDKINENLGDENSISFIQSFTHSLALSFEYLMSFFGNDERENIAIHSLISLGNIGIAVPFIIKAYRFSLPINQINELCTKLESLVLRNRLIGTKANMVSRLNNVYQGFTAENPDIQHIVDRIEHIKNVSSDAWWWAHWNKQALEKSIQGKIHHPIARFLLWKYENHIKSQGKSGYSPLRFDSIDSPELEHIAPSTENPETGYDNYDEEFRNQYLNCLGNYLLISKSHNGSLSNRPFSVKRDSYNHLAQQLEIQKMTADNLTWTKENIQKRKDKITKFITENL